MSSGNLTADRRFAYAQMLRESGDAAAAADVIVQALELAPQWAEGRFALAETLADAGRTQDAVEAYRAYLARDPADSMGAAVRLALLAATPVPAALPGAYVQRLFDDYAPRFDAALTERLGYRAPEALRAAVAAVAPDRTFAAMLDLGCGTGLAGAAFRPMAKWLEGMDLSPRMIAEAERKHVYDQLAAGDMLTHMKTAHRRFDLIIAADVLVYVGALEDGLQAARKIIAPDGLFAFTVQRHDGAGYVLGAEHRYSHSRAYVEASARGAGFAVTRLDDGVFRQEKGVDVPGLLAVLRPV
jgi:predicted TPR repeat methyltransferase